MNKQKFLPLLVLLLFGCSLPNDETIDIGIPPAISDVSVTPNTLNFENIITSSSTIDTTITISATVTDNNGIDNISKVSVVIFSPKGFFFQGYLYDNGVSPDTKSGDGKFASTFKIKFPKDVPGVYQVNVQAVDKNNFVSSNVALTLTVKTLNTAPVIFNLACPDTVTVPSGNMVNLIRVSVSVRDSQGFFDIEYVRLAAYRADSSSAGIFDLYDDGGKKNQFFGIPSGDSLANDGRYTLEIPLLSSVEPNDSKNKYRDFEFFAKDFSGAFSNKIVKRVYIK